MKKRDVILFLLILAAVITAVFLYFYLRRSSMHHESEKEQPGGRLHALPETGAEIIAAYGVTGAGMSERELELDFLETDLVVDEVYVSAGDVVEAGTAVLRITDSSLREAVRELERALMDASLACRQGVTDYETGLLEAENTRRKSLIAAESAQTVYEDTIAKAELQVQKAQQELQEAQELADEYTAALESDYYAVEHGVEEKKAAYEKNMALFFEKLDDYGYELDDDEDEDPNTFRIVKADGRAGQDTDGEATVLELLKSEYQENKEEYDQAVKDSEAATEKARAGMDEAADTLQLKQLALQEALIALEKTKTQAQSEYDISVITGEEAQSVYETECRNLQEAQNRLEDAKEEAQEQYDRFMETIGDGCIYTEREGTILMVQAAEHGNLAVDGVLMAYSDTSQMRITASVDQSEIASIVIGEEAAIVAEDYDVCTGTVREINPIADSSGRASVSYRVILELTDTAELPANLTATVYFGITGTEYEQLMQEWTKEGDRAPYGRENGEGGQREE